MATLKRVSEQTWHVVLGEHEVFVSSAGCWHAAVLSREPRRTLIVLPAGSLKHGVWRAKEWLKQNGPTDCSAGPRG